MAVVLALVLLKADLTKGWAAWLRATVTLSVGLAIAAAVRSFLVPRLRARVATAGHVGEVINMSPDSLRSPLLYLAFCILFEEHLHKNTQGQNLEHMQVELVC